MLWKPDSEFGTARGSTFNRLRIGHGPEVPLTPFIREAGEIRYT